MTNEAEIGSTAINEMAYIGEIYGVGRIVGADRIEAITVICGRGGKWQAIAQRDEFNTGDKCEVYLQDAIVPEDDPRFHFMERYKYRVRMIKLRNTPSEVLVVPLGSDIDEDIKVGTDITQLRGVKKYTKHIPEALRGMAAGSFPPFIPRTDEVNFQKVPKLVAAMQKDWFYITEKCDGTSCTFYHKDGHFGACSRNIEYVKGVGFYWGMAKKYGMEEKLSALGNYAVQAEGVGPGIQKNHMGLDEKEIRVFDVYDIDNLRYLDGAEVYELCLDNDWPMVKVLRTIEGANMSDDDWRELAEGEYDNGHQREGIVVRPIVEQVVDNHRLSFKVINLNYER